MLLGTQMCTNGRGEGWEVLVTTYALAQGDDRDKKFFRKINWNVSHGVMPLASPHCNPHSGISAAFTMRDMFLRTFSLNDTNHYSDSGHGGDFF